VFKSPQKCILVGYGLYNFKLLIDLQKMLLNFDSIKQGPNCMKYA